LEHRRYRGDMIELWKIVMGMENISKGKLFKLDEKGITRSNGYKLIGQKFNTDIAKVYFSNRVVNDWNKLPSNIVSSQNLETFKSRLHKYHCIQKQKLEGVM